MVGVAALMVDTDTAGARRLRAIGCARTTDYWDVLVDPAYAATFVAALAQWLARGFPRDWQSVRLGPCRKELHLRWIAERNGPATRAGRARTAHRYVSGARYPQARRARLVGFSNAACSERSHELRAIGPLLSGDPRVAPTWPWISRRIFNCIDCRARGKRSSSTLKCASSSSASPLRSTTPAGSVSSFSRVSGRAVAADALVLPRHRSAVLQLGARPGGRGQWTRARAARVRSARGDARGDAPLRFSARRRGLQVPLWRARPRAGGALRRPILDRRSC